LVADAVPYFEHFRFFLDNISRGVYPLWDPTRNWGFPMELFLRRIGSYNPFFLLILFSHKMGLPYTQAYLAFLTVYFLAGMVGFYFLAKQIFRDTQIAVLAYMLLLFSALGTRVFDSYLMLTFVPMVWFFYFLSAFFEKPERYSFLGMVFTLMLLVTTYVPFYFLVIFLSFSLCFALIYPKELKIFFIRLWKFSRENKIFVFLCLAALLLALVPGFLFYREGISGQLAIPGRHAQSTERNVLAVGDEHIGSWGIMEDLFYAGYYLDLRAYQFGILYIPVFAYVLFFLGTITAVNKRIILFLTWGGIIFLMGSPHGLAVHQFLKEHVFFFKYFRNLHYFLWLVLLPIFVLFVAEQLRLLLDFHLRSRSAKLGIIVFVAFIHGGLLWFLSGNRYVLVSTNLVVVLSFLFFVFYFLGWLRSKGVIFTLCLLGLVVIQPVEVYRYLTRRAVVYDIKDSYRYLVPYLNVQLPTEAERQRLLNDNGLSGPTIPLKNESKTIPNIYAGAKGINFLIENIDYGVFKKYVAPKFLVYDRVQNVSEKDIDMKRIEQAMAHFENVAFISSDGVSWEQPLGGDTLPHPVMQAGIISENSQELQLLEYDVNFIKVRTHFNTRKFLVYNDSFYNGWEAFINGKKTDIWRANFAFKGIWLPPGENFVSFHFGARWRYVFNYFLMGVFCLVCVCFLRSWFKYFKQGIVVE